MQDLTNIVECYSCGLFVQKSDSSKFTQRCPRCDSKLKEENSHSIDSLFFAISSLMLFLILSLYPILSLNLNAQSLDANILKTVYVLFEQDFYIVSFLVLFTIILASQRAKWELYTRCRLLDSVTLTCIPIYWLDVNWLVSITLPNETTVSQYLIKSISINEGDTPTQQITMTKYYPYYPVWT
jgi:hypothetical protein